MLLSLAVAAVLLLYYVYCKLAHGRQRREFKSGGFTACGNFQPVRVAYDDCCRRFESGGGGSALAVFHRGQLVVEGWSGQWTRRTETNAYSCANSLAAVCLARLVGEGRLDYAQPVARYWPEFAANGKSGVTVGQLMSQTAGLAGLDESIDAQALAQGQPQTGVNDILARQAPLWPPEAGVAREFHHWTWGMYADALVQRADPKGRRLAEYFREEVAEPHGLAVRVGRVSSGSDGAPLARPRPNWHLLWACLTRPEYWPSLRRLLRSLPLPLCRGRLRRLAANACRGALVGRADLACVAAGAVGTAEGFARLFALVAAGQVVRSDVSRRLAEPLVDLPEGNLFCGCRLAIGLGTCPLRMTVAGGGAPSWLLGSPGYGGQFVYCDLDRQLSVAFLTNSLSPMSFGDDPRCRPLLEAAARCADLAAAAAAD